jgi:hypothetical protein
LSRFEKGRISLAELGQLNHEEKVFLAGCIRAIILAEGTLESSELDDLDKIYRRLGFHDYEACLDEFEENIKGEEAFLKEAERVTSPAAQDVILGVAYELSLQNGVPDAAQESIEKKLRAIWSKP